MQPYWWGVNKIRVDIEALNSAQLTIQMIEAVLPDGSLVQLTEQDAPVSLDLSAIEASCLVYLAVPAASSAERFTPELHELADSSCQGVLAQIQLNKLNVQLFAEQPDENDYSCLPLLRIDSVDAEGAQLDYGYIPALLDISDRSLITSALLEYVVKFNDAIDQARTRILDEHSEAQALDILARHRLAKLNQLKCMLWRIIEQPLCHPYYLYGECLAALAELSAYGETPNELLVEPYQHDDLATSLGGLLNHLTQLINAF